jgi:chromosome partitioning protein
MHVIGVLNGKGGVGKTTLTACLAVRATQDDQKPRVAVLDLDPSSSYSQWYRRRAAAGLLGTPENPDLLRGADHASDAVEALRLTSPYNYVFLDGTPGSLLVTEDAIRVSTLVVIPMRASGLDLASSRDVIQACQDLETPYLVVVNDKGQHDGKLVEETRGQLFSWKVPIAAEAIAHRVQYINAMTKGRTGPEKDKKAAEEIGALWGEVKAALRETARAKAA